jgi:hypothetical protein
VVDEFVESTRGGGLAARKLEQAASRLQQPHDPRQPCFGVALALLQCSPLLHAHAGGLNPATRIYTSMRQQRRHKSYSFRVDLPIRPAVSAPSELSATPFSARCCHRYRPCSNFAGNTPALCRHPISLFFTSAPAQAPPAPRFLA